MSTLASHDPGKAAKFQGGEFGFAKSDFEEIARILYNETGIHLPANKATLVYSRIAKRLRALGLENFRQYCELVTEGAENPERNAMISALTTNVTRFFREDHHFRHFKGRILPDKLSGHRPRKRLRVWSAGCSSGQEPYSIALTILSILPDARSFDIRILATDINPHVLGTGAAGIYGADEISDIPADVRSRWLDKHEPGSYRMDDAARGLVSFRQLNLMTEWPMRGPFDAIFCRNVVIYFDEQTQALIWQRMVPLLAPDGVLYIGHSERVIGPAAAQLTLEGTTTYRKRQGAP